MPRFRRTFFSLSVSHLCPSSHWASFLSQPHRLQPWLVWNTDEIAPPPIWVWYGPPGQKHDQILLVQYESDLIIYGELKVWTSSLALFNASQTKLSLSPLHSIVTCALWHVFSRLHLSCDKPLHYETTTLLLLLTEDGYHVFRPSGFLGAWGAFNGTFKKITCYLSPTHSLPSFVSPSEARRLLLFILPSLFYKFSFHFFIRQIQPLDSPARPLTRPFHAIPPPPSSPFSSVKG